MGLASFNQSRREWAGKSAPTEFDWQGKTMEKASASLLLQYAKFKGYEEITKLPVQAGAKKLLALLLEEEKPEADQNGKIPEFVFDSATADELRDYAGKLEPAVDLSSLPAEATADELRAFISKALEEQKNENKD